jgi:WD40 repeat protein
LLTGLFALSVRVEIGHKNVEGFKMSDMSASRFIVLVLVGIGCTALIYNGTQFANGPDDASSENSRLDSKNSVTDFCLSADETRYFGFNHRTGMFSRDIENRDSVQPLSYHDQKPRTIDIGPDRKSILATYLSGHVIQWNENGDQFKPRMVCKTDVAAMCGDISSNGRLLALGDDTGAVTLINLRTGQQQKKIQTGQSKVKGLEFVPRENVFLTSNQQGQVRLWNADSGLLVREYAGHQGLVKSLKISSDGRYFISGGMDGAARLWNVQTGEIIWKLQHQNDSILSVAISSDGAKIAIGGYSNGIITIWDVASRSQLATSTFTQSSITQITFSKNLPKLYFSSYYGGLQTWNFSSSLSPSAGYSSLQKKPAETDVSFFEPCEE